MLNTEEFIERLEILMQRHNLSASVFAEKIGVQRSSISHLLSGRNKPSLDFVLKIIEVFPETDLYWMLQGKSKLNTTHISDQDVKPKKSFSEKDSTENDSDNAISKIIIIYNDGTFSEIIKKTK